MNDTIVQVVVVATVLAVLAALVMKKRRCERFAAYEAYTTLKPSYDELVRRKVSIVRKMPLKKEPGVVYFVVDSKNMLVKDARLPWEGQNYRTVLEEVQDMFGPRAVEAGTSLKKDSAKVQVIYDQRTQEVTKLRVPRQWSMPPRRLRLKTARRTVAVVLNPAPGTRLTGKTLVLKTGSDGRVTSAQVRG